MQFVLLLTPASLSHTPNFTHQIRQSAAVMLRVRVKKHWKKISLNHRERFKHYIIQYPFV